MRGKKGAIEMSVGTIVIIVLSMSMLILGMVLVKNIFSGASSNVLQMNDKVKGEINKLFVEDRRTVIYLPNQKAEIKQNKDWGVAFGIKNLEKGATSDENFRYEVKVSSDDVVAKCGLTATDIERNWISVGRTGNFKLAPGHTYEDIVRFSIPETSPLCIVRFKLEVYKGAQIYDTSSFDVEVVA